MPSAILISSDIYVNAQTSQIFTYQWMLDTDSLMFTHLRVISDCREFMI